MKEGWRFKRFDEVCRLINGRAYKKKELLEDGPYPVLRVGNFFTNQTWYYSDLVLNEDKYCDDGDLLYAWSASFGPRIWQGGKVIYHYHIWKVEFDNKQVDKKFLYYWFDWDKEKIKKEQGAGTTMIHVTKGSMENRSLFLPPLPEQKRIIAILDEAFAGLETAVANTKKNLSTARELFESYLNTIFNSRGDDWIETSLGKIAEFKNGLNFTKNSRGDRVKIVGVKDFQTNYWVPMNELDVAQIDGKLSEAYILNKNDILTVRSNGNKNLIGRCILAGDVTEATSHSGFTIRIRLKSSNVEPKYLVHYLKTGFARDMLVNAGGGVNISSLNQGVLSNLPVCFPNKRKQIDIVNHVENLQSEILSLQEVYSRKLTALAELKQSLLQKAFSGELTANIDNAAKEIAA